MKKVEENKKRKEDALLNTAYKLFTKDGFQNTSISMIVEKAGVAKGTFYLYFKDKLDIQYKLIAYKASQVFQEAYSRLNKEEITEFEDQIVFLSDNIITQFEHNHTLLKLITKHLGWGMFKNALEKGPKDQEAENIRRVYLQLIEDSGREYDQPEVMIYVIVEMIAGSCYNAILFGQPVSIEKLKPFLYDSIRSIIRIHQK